MEFRRELPREVTVQEEEKRRFAAELTEEYHRRRQRRRPLTVRWEMNRRFLLGDQYCDMAVVGDEAWLMPLSGKAVYNMIAPTIETRLSKLSRVQPSLTVRPATDDADDVNAARLATMLLKSVGEELNVSDCRLKAARWAEICGSAFYKVGWDAEAGRKLTYSELHEGMLTMEVIPAFEIYPENEAAEGLERQANLIRAHVCSVAEIYDRWGIRVPGRRLNENGDDIGIGSEVREDSEVVIEWYERPSAEYPEGRYAACAGGILLKQSRLPFVNGEQGKRDFPFVQQLCMSAPGSFFGDTVIGRLIPLQRDYNALINRMNEHTARQTCGNILAEQGSLVDESLLDDGFEPGTVIEYRSGATPPQWMGVSEIPESLMQRLTMLRRDFNEVSGISDMARASAVSGSATSGVALEILKEQDDTRLTLTGENIRRAMKALAKQFLHLMRAYATAQRLMRCGSDEVEGCMRTWTGSDLSSDDVVIDTENELSSTPAQRRQLIMELMNAGLFLDPDTGTMTREARAHLMDIFRIGNWESMTDIDDLQRAAARREHQAVIEGRRPGIGEVDDHGLHISEHTRFMLSARYRSMDGHEKEIMKEHLREHKEMMRKNDADTETEG